MSSVWRVIGSIALAACAGKGEPIGRVAIAPALRTSGDFDGVKVSATAGYHGVSFGLGAFEDQLARPMDPMRHAAGGIELQTRLSLFGMIADDHELERWFDIGFDGGAGGGFAHPASLEGFGDLWGGAWIDVGLGRRRYPALVLGVREVTYTSPWNTETLFTIGVAWVSRAGDPFWFPN